MTKSNIENMKNMIWKKKSFPTTDYILCCVLEELTEINNKLK